MTTYRMSPYQLLTVRTSTAETEGETLKVESTWIGSTRMPPQHFHPAQDEHFEMVEGALRLVIDGTERMLQPGDEIDIPRRVAHAMAAAEGGARAIWQITPALRTEHFFAGMDTTQRRGGKLLDLAPVVRAHSAEIRLTSPPPIVQRPLFAILSAAAKVLRR